MYGMVHRAIRQMASERLGPTGWSIIERDAGSGPAEFISLCIYDDSRTMALLSSAARQLELDMDSALRMLGRYWVRYAEQGSFAAIMDFTGHDLVSFIGNLDRMHDAVRMAMPDARVPSFQVVDSHPGGLRVRYTSEREGLTMFVIGLFEALLDRMGERGSVTPVSGPGNAAEFVIALERD
jgi:guanylate cyclase soluble subunit beta